MSSPCRAVLRCRGTLPGCSMFDWGAPPRVDRGRPSPQADREGGGWARRQLLRLLAAGVEEAGVGAGGAVRRHHARRAGRGVVRRGRGVVPEPLPVARPAPRGAPPPPSHLPVMLPPAATPLLDFS